MKVIYVYADSPEEWNCSQWRCLTPSDAINSKDDNQFQAKLIHVSGFLDFMNPAIQDLVGPASVVVFQRNVVDTQAFDAMEYWQAMGKPAVIDLDDAYHILPWSNPAHKFWLEKDDSVALLHLEEGLRRSNGLLAPNRLLLSDWSHVARGYYMPNYAEAKWWKDLKSRKIAKHKAGLDDKIVIGWGGSVSHYDSWWGSGIREAAQRIVKKYPQVVFMVCGNDPRIHDQLDIPLENKRQQPGVPPEVWPQIVKTFDIGVAPLFGPYDQRRSWIKGVEYMLAGVPWVGTKGEPYADIDEHGFTILNGEKNWFYTLNHMIENLADLQKTADMKIEYAQQQFFAENRVDTMNAMFANIIKDAAQVSTGRLPGVYRG